MLRTTQSFISRRFGAVALAGFLATAGIAGCGGGGGDLATGKVSGKVVHNGQPVTGGSITFTPVKPANSKTAPGKPASGIISSDGSFTMTTYNTGDGAVVGKHSVAFSAPAVEIDEAQHKEDSKPPVSPYAGLIPKTAEAEVKSGSNTINIDLVPDPKSGS